MTPHPQLAPPPPPLGEDEDTSMLKEIDELAKWIHDSVDGLLRGTEPEPEIKQKANRIREIAKDLNEPHWREGGKVFY